MKKRGLSGVGYGPVIWGCHVFLNESSCLEWSGVPIYLAFPKRVRTRYCFSSCYTIRDTAGFTLFKFSLARSPRNSGEEKTSTFGRIRFSN
jgi:hypothetical protein